MSTPTDPSDYWCPKCEHPRDACICEQYGPDDDIGKDREPPDPDGECYRGDEFASAFAESQAWVQRNLK